MEWCNKLSRKEIYKKIKKKKTTFKHCKKCYLSEYILYTDLLIYIYRYI